MATRCEHWVLDDKVRCLVGSIGRHLGLLKAKGLLEPVGCIRPLKCSLSLLHDRMNRCASNSSSLIISSQKFKLVLLIIYTRTVIDQNSQWLIKNMCLLSASKSICLCCMAHEWGCFNYPNNLKWSRKTHPVCVLRFLGSERQQSGKDTCLTTDPIYDRNGLWAQSQEWSLCEVGLSTWICLDFMTPWQFYVAAPLILSKSLFLPGLQWKAEEGVWPDRTAASIT